MRKVILLVICIILAGMAVMLMRQNAEETRASDPVEDTAGDDEGVWRPIRKASPQPETGHHEPMLERPPEDDSAPPGATMGTPGSSSPTPPPVDGGFSEGPPLGNLSPPVRPPEMNIPAPPLNLEMQIHQFVQRTLAGRGPQVEEQAYGLFESEDPVLRITGAALLGEIGQLDEAALKQIAAEKDPAHALAVLGWLQDAGLADEAGTLRRMLTAQGLGGDALAQLFSGGRLEGISGRAALAIMDSELTDEDKHNLYLMIANDPAQTYDVRMKALVDLRSTMSLTDYRGVVNNVRQAAAGQDALWDEGLKRLDNRLQGPLELMQGPLTVSPQDIDLMVAREYPRMLEDLALHLEYSMAQPDSRIVSGTAERLDQRLERLQQMPWTAEQAVSLKRLEGLVGTLQQREQDHPVSASPNQAPPGF